MDIDSRFAQEVGREVFSGSELLLKGALETEGGVQLLTGYPGAPVGGFFHGLEVTGPLLWQKAVVARPAGSAALSVAMVDGARTSGCRGLAVMSASSIVCAGDALALGVLEGRVSEGGGLIVCGDDADGDRAFASPDPRVLAQQIGMPVIEPSGPQEIKDWVNGAFLLSAVRRSCVTMMLSGAQAQGGGTVECLPNQAPSTGDLDKQIRGYGHRGTAPWSREGIHPSPDPQADLERRIEVLKSEAHRLGINRILHGSQKGQIEPVGFIATGMAYTCLHQALVEMGLVGRVPILKMGLSYPLDAAMVADFAGCCQQIIVVEPHSGFVEGQVRQATSLLCQASGPEARVYGQRFPGRLPGIPNRGALDSSTLIERLAPLLADIPALAGGGAIRVLDATRQTSAGNVVVPEREATFCAGCPHRDSTSVLLELQKDLRDPHYMLARHKRKPVELVVHGDVGCHSLLGSQPNTPLVRYPSGRGLGGGYGAGAGLMAESRHVAFIGDGALMDRGQTAISHSLATDQRITYIVLGDPVTEVTRQRLGGPGTGVGSHRPVSALETERIIKAIVPKQKANRVSIVRINPEDRRRYRKLLEQMVLSQGLNIVVAQKECGITHHRRQRDEERVMVAAHGYLPRKTYMNVATDVCEYCLECTRQTGCPGLTVVETDNGPKIQTDQSTCVNDGACHRIDACPSFEQVTVVRKQPARTEPPPVVDQEDLPDPPRPVHADQPTWRCHLAGVGGMGVGLCTKVLVRAGHEMGYQVQFVNHRGMAPRSGSVVGQLVYARSDIAGAGAGQASSDTARAVGVTTPAILYGQADLILGLDLLEAARAIDPRSRYRVSMPHRTAVVVNTDAPHTTQSLMGRGDIQGSSLEAGLRRQSHPDRYVGIHVGDWCERLLGSRRYTNTAMLGIAYQKGLLPVKVQAIEAAIRRVLGSDAQNNLRAFAMGRGMVAQSGRFKPVVDCQPETVERTIRKKVRILRCRSGRGPRAHRVARQFAVLLKQMCRAANGHDLDDRLRRGVVTRTYDCVIWGGINYGRRYGSRLARILQRDDPAQGYALTRAVAWNLAKVMLIKDEPYVAALLTDPEKIGRDRKRFNVNAHRGDKIIYRHYLHPQIKVAGRRIRFEWTSRPWQLRVLSRLRFLRDLLPGWHRRERGFRDWYEGLVDRLDWDPSKGSWEYQRWLGALSVPESVTGFGQVRYPKMEAARLRAEQLLAADPPPADPMHKGSVQGKPSGRTVPLPVLVAAQGSIM